jgi:hypothetical protein
MAKSLSVASIVALAMVSMTMGGLTGPAMAQARLDSSAATAAPVAVSGSSPQGAAPQRISAPVAPSSMASPARAGSLQGFGPMQANPLLGAQPLQEVGK